MEGGKEGGEMGEKHGQAGTYKEGGRHGEMVRFLIGGSDEARVYVASRERRRQSSSSGNGGSSSWTFRL